MKTVLLLGGPADGQRREIHGVMTSVYAGEDQGTLYQVVPLCSHGEVHWFGVLDGADPLALLIGGYNPVASMISDKLVKGIDADADRKCIPASVVEQLGRGNY